MKKGILLIVILCLTVFGSYAQKAKKKTGKKSAYAARTAKKKKGKKRKGSQAADDGTATTVPINIGPSTVDTTKKIAVEPPPPPRKKFVRPFDGYFKRSDVLNAKVKPFPILREADVAYSKRVWREIDLREKMNQYMASPKMSLINVIMDAIDDGELQAYDPTPTKDDIDGDAFGSPLSGSAAHAKLADSVSVDKFDKDGNKIATVIVAGQFNPDSIVKYRIKEDWIFDRQRSVFEPRIIGIAPMVRPKAGDGTISFDYQPAFWIYFPQARPVFVNREVVSKRTDASGLSFDDVFMKRLFSSYIVKQSNEKNQRIKDYATGIDKLYEAERIKKELMDWELNLWQY